MIVKKVPNPKYSAAIPDRIRGLTSYIVRPELTDPAEKCLCAGARGFICDNLRDQQNEMIALATAPKRAVEPIIHYVLSWHEDEMPTSKNVEQAVDLFLAHLGLSDCQVVYGLHIDTANVHLHLCVNRIDPASHKAIRVNGGFDLEAAHQAIAIIEDEQGWRRETNARYVASGPNIYRTGWDAERPAVSARAQDKELRNGEISAESKAHHVLRLALETAQSWSAFHAILARAGMIYRREGNGAVIVVDGVQVKASTALRAASWSKLIKRFGDFKGGPAAPIAAPVFTPWVDERRQATCAIIGRGEASPSSGWHEVAGFQSYRVGGRTYYSRRRGGAVSFVDEGERIRVLDSRDEEAARAALKLAAAKWPEGVTVEGSADFRRLMARLAAEEGINVTNPEMQVDIRNERAIHQRKLATEAQRISATVSLAQILDPLRANRYEVLVPGRTRPGEEAQGARQVLSSPDGRGFGIDALADAVHDAQARGAAPTEIQLVPRALDQDYLVSSAQAAPEAGDHPLLPGPARLALALPGGRTMALGSARRGDRLSLHQLASEVSDHGLPSEPAKKAKGSNPRPDLARHTVPYAAKHIQTVAGKLDDNPALEARRDAHLAARQNAEGALADIGLEPVRLLRSPPDQKGSARVNPDHAKAIARLRADVMQDFPSDQWTHPSRVDTALALRLRAVGRTRKDIGEIISLYGAGPYQADPYVTPTIYADRLADYAFSSAGTDWLRDHQHLAKVWEAVILGAPVPWPDQHIAVAGEGVGSDAAHATEPETALAKQGDELDKAHAAGPRTDVSSRVRHDYRSGEDNTEDATDLDPDAFLALVAKAHANLKDLPEFGGPDHPAEPTSPPLGIVNDDDIAPSHVSDDDLLALISRAADKLKDLPEFDSGDETVEQPDQLAVNDSEIEASSHSPPRIPVEAALRGDEQSPSGPPASPAKQDHKDSPPAPNVGAREAPAAIAQIPGVRTFPSDPGALAGKNPEVRRAEPKNPASARSEDPEKISRPRTQPLPQVQRSQPGLAHAPEHNKPTSVDDSAVPAKRLTIDDLMKGLPAEVPILLAALRSQGHAFPGETDPLAPVKRLVLAYPQYVISQPGGQDRTFSISASLSVRKMLTEGLDASEDEARTRRARIKESVVAIKSVIRPRWDEMARTSPCALYKSEAGSPLRSLVKLWLDHRRILDQPGIPNSPDKAFRAHWVCRRLAEDLAPLMPDHPTNPLTNWPNLRAAVGMTVVAELMITTPKIGPKNYQQMLQAARVELGQGRASVAAGSGRSTFPPALPSQLTETQRQMLLLAARLDGIGQSAMTDRMLAHDRALSDIHAFARAGRGAKEDRDGPDRESLIAAIKATQRAMLDRSWVEPILRPLGASPQLIARILAQPTGSARGR
jgi:hypothetical protein